MKLKDGFVTHEMGGEQIMVATGNASYTGLVRSNATAAFIVDCLKQETSRENIIQTMLNRYDAPEAVIAADVDMVITKLRSIGALDE